MSTVSESPAGAGSPASSDSRATAPSDPADVSSSDKESSPDGTVKPKKPKKENLFKEVMRKLDLLQRSHRSSSFLYGVIKKYGDDNGGSLAALLTYYGFLSVFPLLLVMLTVVGLLASPKSSFEHHIVNSALAQFPVIGNKLESNITTLHRNSAIGLTIGILGLIWGSTGVCQNAQYAMAQVWNIPKINRPGYLPRLGRSGLLLLVGAVFLIVSSGLTGVATFSGKQGVVFRLGGGLLGVVADVALFVIVFRVLTPKNIEWRDLLPGSIFAGLVWGILQIVGVFLMDHELKNMSQVYGFFAIVLGILWWIYLAAQVVVYSAEINVVRARRLWPRSLVQPPLTPADITALGSYALVEHRRPEVSVSIKEMDAADPSAASPTES